ALVHNNVPAPAAVTVALDGARKTITVPPSGHVRVGFPVRVTCDGPVEAGEIAMCPTSKSAARPAIRVAFEARAADGTPLDAVEQSIPATFAGLDEHPRIDGSFTGSRTIALRVPKHVSALDGAGTLVVLLGAQMWPELGERLRYLLGYPHGCVEQTTSST